MDYEKIYDIQDMSSYKSSRTNLVSISTGYPNGPPIIAASSIVTSYKLEPDLLPFLDKHDVRTLIFAHTFRKTLSTDQVVHFSTYG